ncbi:MAG: DUF1573 domain-containing protein [Candidatus Levybacteria bacterium]|nr:DUF1573 domain-containing protein [Candidatus Levybacteria bacterium]
MDKKAIIGILVFTALIIVGAILFSNNSPSKTSLQKTTGASIQTFETSFDFKNVPYSGGNVEHPFKIKNFGTADLTIANMSTSCMCTQVFLQKGSVMSPRFGMTGHASEGAWKGVLKPGEEASIVAVFDPTAHGPSGVGPISRLVSFETNDPDHPYVEFSFSGVVVK